jgi:hypothetical protein
MSVKTRSEHFGGKSESPVAVPSGGSASFLLASVATFGAGMPCQMSIHMIGDLGEVKRIGFGGVGEVRDP